MSLLRGVVVVLLAWLLIIPQVVSQDTCTLCYDRGPPQFGDRVVNTDGLTCTALDEVARNESSINSTSESCTNFFHPWGFLACGCVEPPPPANPSCTFCPDGSSPPAAFEDRVIIPQWGSTCADFDAFVQFIEDADTCAGYQQDSDILCGCPSGFPTAAPLPTVAPAPTPAPGPCSVCSDGSNPTKGSTLIIASFGNYTCQQLADDPSVIPDAECASLQSFFDNACGCGEETPAPSPTENPPCPLCNDGTYPNNVGVTIVTSFGNYTCEQLAEEGPNGLIPRDQCVPLQNFSYSPCGCGQGTGPPVAPTPAPSPTENPPCPICNDGTYPNNVGVTIVTSFGNYTCEQLAEEGPNGLIPIDQCVPLQNFSYSPCGCGQGAGPPVSSTSPTMAPTPSTCPFCGDGTFPNNPDVVITASFGNFTCAQLANGDADGLIPAMACSTVQDFIIEPCGCGNVANTPPPTPGPCSLCSDGSYPRNTSVLVLTSFGNYTCTQLADDPSLIPGASCSLVQESVFDECGCGGVTLGGPPPSATSTEAPTPSPSTPSPTTMMPSTLSPTLVVLAPTPPPSVTSKSQLVMDELSTQLVKDLHTTADELETADITSDSSASSDPWTVGGCATAFVALALFHYLG